MVMNYMIHQQETGYLLRSNMNMQRFGHTASVLTSGQVLVVGGFRDNFTNTAELYDSSTGT